MCCRHTTYAGFHQPQQMSDEPLTNVFQAYKFLGLHTSRGANKNRRTAMSASGGNAREILSARCKGSPSSSSFHEGTNDIPCVDATFTSVAHDPVLPAGPITPAAKRARTVATNPSPSSSLLPNFAVDVAPATTDMAISVQPGSDGDVPRVIGGHGHAAHNFSVSQGSIPTLAPKPTSASNNFISPRRSAQLLTTPVVGTSTSSAPTLLTTSASATATEAADPTSGCPAGTTGGPPCLHPQAPASLEDIRNRILSTSRTGTSTRRKTTRSVIQVPATATGSSAASSGSGRHTRTGSSKPSAPAFPSPPLLVPSPPPPPPGVPEKLGDRPLRLVIVGHNPSAHAWQSGHYYSHPANHMWRLLIATGIAPPGTRSAEDDDRLPAAAGVGFLDVGCGHPGTDSSSFSSEVFKSWSQAFYARLKGHMDRASASIGCSCGLCGAPSLVAFSGKRHYLELLNVGKPPKERVKTVEHGPQKLLPAGWPFPAAATEVWVCSSTSGAAALTREQREAPYRRLAEKMREIEWPRRMALKCISAGSAPNNAAHASLAEAKTEAVETVTVGAEMEGKGEEELMVVEGENNGEDDEKET